MNLAEILGKIGFDWRMSLFSLFNFLIIFFILKKLFFKTVLESIKKKETDAKETEENFIKAKTELGMAEANAKEIINSAKADANLIFQQATNESKRLSEIMKEKAKEEIASLVEKTKKDLKKEKMEMKRELKTETVDLVVATLEKFLFEKIDQKEDSKIINSIIENIKI